MKQNPKNRARSKRPPLPGEASDSRTLTPKLRFPEFRKPWDEVPLGHLAQSLSDRVGTTPCIPYTVTSGVGLLSQEDKFGRTIAGNSLRNYIRLRKDDFAYNKSATKAFPEGYIARHMIDAKAAVPNSIFTCFRVDSEKIEPAYLDFLFAGNLHGRWLCKFLTVGARAHGSLNVSDDDLMALPVPLPSTAEQRKIAACLGSLDEWIGAESAKLEALRSHKKGLMQQLFPRPGESRPRLRFPEFHNAGEWETKTLGDIFDTATGGTPERTVKAYWHGGIPWVTTSLVDFNVIDHTDETISDVGLEKSAAKMFPKGTILMALYGQGKTRGKVAMLGIEATTNQACAAILPTDAVDQTYAFLYLAGRYDEIRALSNAGGQENLSQGLLRELPFAFPKDGAEQQRIAACLSTLDALLSATSRKVEALKHHKKGLMQHLYPSPEGR